MRHLCNLISSWIYEGYEEMRTHVDALFYPPFCGPLICPLDHHLMEMRHLLFPPSRDLLPAGPEG